MIARAVARVESTWPAARSSLFSRLRKSHPIQTMAPIASTTEVTPTKIRARAMRIAVEMKVQKCNCRVEQILTEGQSKIAESKRVHSKNENCLVVFTNFKITNRMDKKI
jgi:hypothetical protein